MILARKILVVCTACVALAACDRPMSTADKGAIGGAALGTGIGLVTGGSFGAVVGAGSVVTRDVPDNAMVVTRAEERQIGEGGLRYRMRKQAAKQSKKG